MSDDRVARVFFCLAAALIIASIWFCAAGDMGRAFYFLSIGLFIVWGLKE